MRKIRKNLYLLFADAVEFTQELGKYIARTLHFSFIKFEKGKGVFVTSLYRQRGKQARRLMQSSIVGLTAMGMIIAPVIAEEFPGRQTNPWDIPSPSSVLSVFLLVCNRGIEIYS